MKNFANRWFLPPMMYIALSMMSFTACAGVAGYIDCDIGASGINYLDCVNNKWEYNDCTAKVDCATEEFDSTLEGYAGIGFGHLDGSLIPCYYASYYFKEDGVYVCNGDVQVNLEDSNETKYVCQNDTKFTFKVKCPPEGD
jgi:hypothetical protein